MIAMTGGATLRCADYATFGSQQLSINMLKALEDRTACLLANHGAICFAATLEKTLDLSVEVESLCRQYAIASSLGSPVVLEGAEMERIQDLFKTYGKQPDDLEEDESVSGRSPIRRDQPTDG